MRTLCPSCISAWHTFIAWIELAVSDGMRELVMAAILISFVLDGEFLVGRARPSSQPKQCNKTKAKHLQQRIQISEPAESQRNLNETDNKGDFNRVFRKPQRKQ